MSRSLKVSKTVDRELGCQRLLTRERVLTLIEASLDRTSLTTTGSVLLAAAVDDPDVALVEEGAGPAFCILGVAVVVVLIPDAAPAFLLCFARKSAAEETGLVTTVLGVTALDADGVMIAAGVAVLSP